MLGTRAPRLHQGRGVGAEGCTLAGSAGHALRRADRQAVRGRGAQREVETRMSAATACAIQHPRARHHRAHAGRASTGRRAVESARQGIAVSKRTVAQTGSLRRKRCPISNNLCENAIRPFVVGRKGWLFSDTVAGAQASANLYSLVETCKANGIDPYRYLVWLFANLPHASTADSYAALLPWASPYNNQPTGEPPSTALAVNDGHARPAIAILLLLYPLPIRRDTDSLGIPTNHHGEQIIQPIRCKNLDRVIRK